MLAYYVEWHLREAWRELMRELMFADEDQQARQTRDPLAAAQRSATAQHKAQARQLPDGMPAHSSSTVRNVCRTSGAFSREND